MFISHKSNVLKQIHETEWGCRRKTKNIGISDYWNWIETIKDADGNPDYSGEGYTIVECPDEDENVEQRLAQLDDYISDDGVYNIKYYVSKRDAEEILDIDDKSHDPKQYVQSHFIGDDTAKDKRILDEEWTRIRKERTRLLAETDHLALSDQTLSADMKTYRKSLRDLPSDQSSKTKYSDITWPTKP